MKNYKPGWHFLSLYKAAFVALIIISSAVFFRCSPAVYIPSVLDETKSGIALDTLKQGRMTYVTKCNSCHNLYLPEQFTAAEWKKNVGEMQTKAQINDADKIALLKYLGAHSRK